MKARFLTATALTACAVAAPAVAQDADGKLLEELVVTADRGFGAETVQAGGFRNAQVLDTPLTVNVIPRAVLDAQAAEGLYDALRNTGGVTRSQLSGGTYDNIAIRGILVENRGNYRLNGSLPVINLIEQPLEDKARIEVLKGASGLYYGFVPPSGVINMTTKRAQQTPVTAFTVRGDEHGTVIGAADIGRRFADDRLGVRLNVAGGQVATGVDRVKGDRGLVALALDIDPSDRIRFDIDYEYIEKDIAEPAAIALLPAVGGVIPLPDVPDPTTNLAGGWQRYDAHAQNVLARIDVSLSPRWALKLEGGQARTERDRAFSQFQNYDLATGEGTLRIFQTRGQAYENLNVRTELTGLVATGPVEHEFTFGWTRNEREQSGAGSIITNVSQNLFAPRSIAPIALTTKPALNPSVIIDEGLYVLDRMTWGPVQLLTGLRWSDYESISSTSRYVANEAAPVIAAIYKPHERLSFYATYLEGLEEGGIAPANAVNAFEILPPAKSNQWELGVKAEPLEGLIASLSYFEITRPSAFRNGAGVFLLDGETEYRGVELMASGDLTDRIAVVASALWLDASQERAADALVVGRRPENTPEWTASLFANWRAPVEGLSVSAGVFYTGERPVNARNEAFVDDYATAAFGARYATELAGKETTFQVNLENAFDKAYWNTAGNALIGVGAPRTLKFSVSTAL